MVKEARRIHAGVAFRWVQGDALPSLEQTLGLGQVFDFIRLSAVWNHLRPSDRALAFQNLLRLLAQDGPVVSSAGRVLGIVEAAVKEDADGGSMQLTNFARSAHVASLLFPPQTLLPPAPVFRSREQAVAHAMKAVCQIETE